MNREEQSILYDKRDPYFESATSNSLWIGGLFHLVLLSLFLWNRFDFIAIYNLISFAVFGVGFLIQKRQVKYTLIIFTICSIEVLVHALIATYSLGVDSNFMLFIWLVPLVLALSVQVSITKKIIVTGIMFVTFFTSVILFKRREVCYEVSLELEEFFGLFCVAGTIVVAFLILFYFVRIIKSKEEAVLREIYHRLFNNTQLSVSIGNLFSRNMKNEEFSDKLRQLNDINHVMSIVHRSVHFNRDQGVVKSNKIISEIGGHLSQDFEFDSKNIDLLIDDGIPLGIILFVILKTNNINRVEVEPGVMSFHSKESVSLDCGQDYKDLLEIFVEQLEGELNISESIIEVKFKTKVFK